MSKAIIDFDFFTKLNESIESVAGAWEFNRDSITGKATLDFFHADSNTPVCSIPVTLEDMADLQTLFAQMDKHLNNLEIERKFLLKKLPHAIPDDVIVMNQYYGQDEEQKFRIRQSIGLVSGVKHVRTIKTVVSDGIFVENEYDLSADEFQELRSMCDKVIRKTRFVYGIPGTDLKWEVDTYHDLSIVTAEIELPYIDYPFLTELYMDEVIDKEVTGQPEYFNSTLAVPYEHQTK